MDAHIGTARVQHDFGAVARLTNVSRVGYVDRLAIPTAPRNLAPAADPTAIGRQRFETSTDNLSLINQTDLRLQFATAFLKHVANVGAELARESRKQTRHNFQLPGQTGSGRQHQRRSAKPRPARPTSRGWSECSPATTRPR